MNDIKRSKISPIQLVFFALLTVACLGYTVIQADTKVLVSDTFDKDPVGSKPNGYLVEETGGKVEIADIPGAGNKSLAVLDPGGSVIKVIKGFTPQTNVVTVELSFMQPNYGSTTKVVRLLDKDNVNVAVQIETRKPNKFGYKTAEGAFAEFVEYKENVWSTVTVIADVSAQKADVYCDGELKLSQVPFLTKVDNIGMIDSYSPGSSGKTHFLDNIKVTVGAVKPALVQKVEPVKPVEPVNYRSTLITDLKVYSPTTPWAIKPSLQEGTQQYVDRAFYIAKLPDTYAGCEYIQTACDSKNYFKDPLVSFKVTADVEVYVASDNRVVTKPEWLRDWVDTGDDIVNTEATPTVFSVFKKKFAANSEVVLGQNGQSGGATHYMVIIKGTDWNQAKAKLPPTADVPVVASWKGILGLRPEWYASKDAVRVAENVLLYQYDTGGWYKNIDMAAPLLSTEKKIIEMNKVSKTESTIDNNATTTQIRFLAKVYTATKDERYKDAVLKGLNFLFAAQYDNGGWPQYYPEQTLDYYKRITYNDGAINEVLRLMQSIVKGDQEFRFIDQAMRIKAQQAFDKGIDCILKTQVRVNGKLTVWGAQHHEKTLQPAEARAYEKISLASAESAGLVTLLMSLDHPSSEVIEAIQSAVEWFQTVELGGIEVRQQPDPKLATGYDVVVINNLKAPPIWARFYEIGTYRPIFSGRDGVVKYNLAEIEHERRTGYSWYNFSGANLMANEYPAWQKKWAPNHNVLKK